MLRSVLSTGDFGGCADMCGACSGRWQEGPSGACARDLLWILDQSWPRTERTGDEEAATAPAQLARPRKRRPSRREIGSFLDHLYIYDSGQVRRTGTSAYSVLHGAAYWGMPDALCPM